MCSICGIADFTDSRNIDEKIAESMGKTLTHRGPDQNGLYLSENIVFQHNRLAILDIENGIQPMTRVYEGKSYTIIYNGEIYNTQQLEAELAAMGIHPQTRCDTEIVLYSYIAFGESCPEKLNGIFAFAVYDESENKLFLARDRFGIKPLYYAQKGSSLLFASEIKALLRHPLISPVIDNIGLWQLLFLSPVSLNGSGVFRDIFEVKPAHCGIFKDGALKLWPYWRLKALPFDGGRADAVETTKTLLCDAIKGQLVSDVPLCTLLSGGLDSSVITSVAARAYNDADMTLETYSFEYEGNKEHFKSTLFQPQSDDFYASYLSDQLGTKHHILRAPTIEIAKLLTKATEARDLPGQADIDSSLLYFCSLIEKGHTVALSGECADEIFGGYPWFYRDEMLSKPFFPWIHDPFKRVSLFNPEIAKPDEGFAYLSDIYRKDMDSCPSLECDSPDMLRSRKATWLSVNYFMTSLLERKDRMSMASGVEVRVPFADHRILEYVYNVPWDIKFENQTEKALLRAAMSDYLPDVILHRKKSPYPKTHNPEYEHLVTGMLGARLSDKNSPLAAIINKKVLDEFLVSGNEETWFGQLMSKPQLIAWLIQLDFWLTEYKVELKI